MRLTTLTSLLAVLASVLLGSAAFAHGGMEHIMGTVADKTDKTLTVTTKDGKTMTLDLGDMTEFEKGGKAATAADVAKGDRVAIHAMKMGEGPNLMAHMVKIGAAGTVAKKSSTSKSHEEKKSAGTTAPTPSPAK